MEEYQKSISQLFDELQVTKQGLSQQEANKRLLQYGDNELQEPKSPHWILIFFSQFKDLLVIILIVAALISAISGQFESTIVIIMVISLNALLSSLQTIKAQKSLQSLKKLTTPKVKVKRDNQIIEINASKVTLGDLVVIEAGDVIVADGRLIEANNLYLNESALTGEPLSIEKSIAVISHDCLIADQTNMVFSGSLVTSGSGQYLVTGIAMNSQIGKIAHLLNATKDRKTPLQKTLDSFSFHLSTSIIVICLIVFLISVLLTKEKILNALMVAVALAVAAIPEALGSIVTIVLAISTQKMAKENAIVKNLNAIESLGCVSVICSDKTGTLTQNKMTVIDFFTNNQNYNLKSLDHRLYNHQVLLKTMVICNDATLKNQVGDPLELALLEAYNDYSFNHHYTVNVQPFLKLPFDSSRKLMSVSSKNHLYTKGAIDILIQRCNQILIDGLPRVLTKQDQQMILKQNELWAKEGKRVIALAYKKFYRMTLSLSDEHDLIFIGLISLIDPPRKESYDAIKICKQAGIKTIMITGDHLSTASKIAGDLQILSPDDLIVDGYQLAKMSDEMLYTYLPQISVYGRVAPVDKIRIVKAWQKSGFVVAMTGDGVNDAPALKQSDIGVAMGSGSEVAKDGASLVLTDDNFATIVRAIIRGRIVYTNIKNAIIYLLSGNLSAIICVLLTTLLLLPTPFLPVHLLFINLITDSLPAIALGMESGNEDIIKQKPRDINEALLNQETMIQISFEGLIISIFTLLGYFLGLKSDELTASTMAFAILSLARLFHGFNCRSNLPLIYLPLNYYSLIAFIIGTGLLITILILPDLHQLFSISDLSLRNLALIFVLGAFPSLIIQCYKMIVFKHNDS